MVNRCMGSLLAIVVPTLSIGAFTGLASFHIVNQILFLSFRHRLYRLECMGQK